MKQCNEGIRAISYQHTPYIYTIKCTFVFPFLYGLVMGLVMEVWLSCYLVLLLVDSKTRWQDSHSFMTQPVCAYIIIPIAWLHRRPPQTVLQHTRSPEQSQSFSQDIAQEEEKSLGGHFPEILVNFKFAVHIHKTRHRSAGSMVEIYQINLDILVNTNIYIIWIMCGLW